MIEKDGVKIYRNTELVELGKPLLVTMPSSNAAFQWAKEIAYTKQVEPLEVDLELNDPDGIRNAVNGSAEGAFIVMGELNRASEENIAAMMEVRNDPARFIVVTGNKIPAGVKPHDFGHYYKI